MKKPAPRKPAAAPNPLLTAEGLTQGLLPQTMMNSAAYRGECALDAKTLAGVFARARTLLTNDFIGGLHQTRLTYFSDGLRLTGETAQAPSLLTWLKAQKLWPILRRLQNDAWREWLLQDNVVALWLDPAEGDLPKVVILDCEILEYSNKLGNEVLKVKPKATGKLSDTEKEALGPRWAKAYENGTLVTIEEGEGEHFKVLTWEKLGNGFGMPRIKGVLELLSSRALLQTSDWVGAWESVNMTELWNLGHEIKNGPKAGDRAHFITAKKQEALEKALKKVRGGKRVVANFDVKMAYKYLDPAFFNDAKYKGTMAALKAWAGAPATMAEGGMVSPQLMQTFATEGRKHRELMADFLGGIINDAFGPPEEIILGWNPHSFLDPKAMLELLRLAGANAWASPQTAREFLGLDNTVEGDRLVAAHKDPKRYAPPFEAKQGMLSKDGGRPPNDPATAKDAADV